ncbi:DUF4249 family protein [candidate division KSB1 bacterium]|nr:DUF4249 family protein [candidate division KSB1 bacterium]RQW04766.1 MAG: DUF4249 family protein [candidate division KSB1 bacterium]
MIRQFKILYKLVMPLLSVLLLTCTRDNPTTPNLDYESEIVVFGLLLMTERDSGQQKTVRIERSYKVTDYLPDYPEDRAIKDALVYVESRNQRVKFEHLFASTYSDVEEKLQLVPGELYTLNITLTDGHKITSQCLMPDRPTILFPTANTPVKAYQPLTVQWEHARFAHRYQIAIEDNVDGFQFSILSDSDQEELYAFLFARPNHYILKVASLDQNYYDYLRSRSNREPILRIDGALGVFGAIVYDRERFVAVTQ